MRNHNVKYTYNEVCSIIKEKEAELLSKEYTNNMTKLEIKCKCGNIFNTSLIGFRNGKTTCDECSGVTKWNVKTVGAYIKENTKCELISDVYINNNTKLTLKCQCGECFETRLTQIQRGLNSCKKCSRDNKVHPRKKSLEEVSEVFKSNGLEFLEKEYKGFNVRHKSINKEGYFVFASVDSILRGTEHLMFGIGNPLTTINILKWLQENESEYKLLDKNVTSCKTKINIMCDKGHKYKVAWSDFKSGRRCPMCKNEKISKALINTIDNFSKYVYDITDGEYICMSKEYMNSHSHVEIQHVTCGKIFKVTPAKFTGSKSRNGSRCPICQDNIRESVHAKVLKQLFREYKRGVTLEDRSCINPETGFPLPTDIVCYDEKIVVEVQSWYHDREEQIKKDKVKKKFWEEKGFMVYTPDIRKYNTLSMAQLFFPALEKIPEWVDYNYGESNIDIRAVQEMLDNYCSTKEIGNKFEVSRHKIQKLIDNKEVFIHDDHWKVNKNVKKICKLNLKGELISTYDNATIAAKENLISQTGISKAINLDNKYCNGFIWVSEEDFISRNYTINIDIINPHKKCVVQLDLNKNYISEYTSLAEATNKCNISRDALIKNLKGRTGKAKGYIWMYKDDYCNMLKSNNKQL